VQVIQWFIDVLFAGINVNALSVRRGWAAAIVMRTVRPTEVAVNTNATRDEGRKVPNIVFAQVSSISGIGELQVYQFLDSVDPT
jgi:hypothetical protein